MKYIIDTEKQTMEPVTPLTPGGIGEAIDKLSEMYTKNIGYISFGDVLPILRRLAEAVDTLEKRPTTFIPFGTFPSPLYPWAKVRFNEPLYPILTGGTTCAVNQADGESEPQQDDHSDV